MRLAIVIPYYKADFLPDLLDALVAQSDPRFAVYLGDDAAPQPAAPVVAAYADRLTITQHRFGDNLGGRDLAGQWNRCLALLGDEDWVWMLPDDDLPGPDCVAAFHAALEALEADKIGVLHLPFLHYDMAREAAPPAVPSPTGADPVQWDSLQFYRDLMAGRRQGATLGNTIYPRRALEQGGGFVSLPKGWGSDHATMLRVAGAAGGRITHLPDAWLTFRMSGQNISSGMADGVEKMQGRIAFVRWLKANEAIFAAPVPPDFYEGFYLKGEFYYFYRWRWSFALYRALLEFRRACLGPGAQAVGLRVRLQLLALTLRNRLRGLPASRTAAGTAAGTATDQRDAR